MLLLGLLPGMAAASGAPNVLQVRTTTDVTLPDPGGTLLAVKSLALPAGSWTVTANLTAVNFGAGDFIRCQLQDNGTLFSGGSTVYLANRGRWPGRRRHPGHDGGVHRGRPL